MVKRRKSKLGKVISRGLKGEKKRREVKGVIRSKEELVKVKRR